MVKVLAIVTIQSRLCMVVYIQGGPIVVAFSWRLCIGDFAMGNMYRGLYLVDGNCRITHQFLEYACFLLPKTKYY